MRNLKKRGFTLIEMLIVVVIIGILAAALIPRLSSAKGRANDTSRSTAISQIGTALGVYVLDSGYPTAELGSTGTGVQNLTTILNAAGMTNIPKDPDGKSHTIFNIPSSGYVVIPVKKGSASGYVVAAQVEDAKSANWAEINAAEFSGALDVTTVTFCTAMTSVTGTPADNCQYNSVDKLRRVQVY